MPRIHERTFRVRHYECDAYGHVNHANYLRYMQEAAFDASAAAGYDIARYEMMGTQWLIRETDISYLHPLTYGDAVTIRTWVDDFHRVRSRRAYEFRHAVTGELVAEARTDWVYLDIRTQRPVTIPEEMIAAFYPEGLPEQRTRREPFPDVTPPPAHVFTVRRRVEWRDLDTAQHVNNAMYMAYLEDCGTQVAEAFGWPIQRMMEAGFGIVVRRYRIEHKLPARMGDELELATWISDVKRSSAVRHYTILRVQDRALLARAHVLWVWIGLLDGRPIRIPDDFRADFAGNVSLD
jgi:acyl-CoA thioester hydrolase